MAENFINLLPDPPQNKTGWPWTEGSDLLPDFIPDGSPWPKISIVTPSYNQADYLEETIRSVLLQNYPNLEYIIIDGGSSDGSVEIIKKYERWLTLWESKKDRGQSHAINKGWKQSTGVLLAWVNADDYLENCALKKVADIYHNKDKKDLGFIHGKSKTISANGWYLSERGAPFNLVECLRSSSHPIAQPSTFISSQAIKNIGYLDENLHMSMDFDLYLRIAKDYATVFTHEYLSYFRMTKTSKTATVEANFGPDHELILNKFYSYDNISPRLKSIKREAYLNTYLRSFSGYMRLNDLQKARNSYFKALIKSPVACFRNTKKYYLRYLLFGRKNPTIF